MIKITKIYRSTEYDNRLLMAIRGGGYIIYPDGIKVQNYNADHFIQMPENGVTNIIKSYNNKIETLKKIYGSKLDSKLVEYVGEN